MKIFIISDLHLGGRPHPKNGAAIGATSPLGSQICHAYEELTQFIDWVASQGADAAAVELVINGDIVDFLMEDDYLDEPDAVPWLPDEARVLEKLKLIIKRTRETNQRGPFEAMADLLASGQLLTFILGNHDVELSLPAIRRYLEEEVFKIGSTGKFRFIYDGEAYVRGDLLVEHGNRYDPWNVIDHSALRQERSMLSRGLGQKMCERKSAHFLPPPGSILVTKVINQIKKKYRFVDLLKPESHVQWIIFWAFFPKLKYSMDAILLYCNQRKNKPNTGTSQPQHDGQLGAISEEGDLTLDKVLEQVFGNDISILGVNSSMPKSQLSASEAWEEIKILTGNTLAHISDKTSLLVDSLAAPKLKTLHLALRKLRNEDVISTTWEYPHYLNGVIDIGNESNMNYVVFGHTHLPKHMKVRCTEREITYLNTGTWADTMQIPNSAFNDQAMEGGALQAFVDDLKKNQLDSYIKRQLTYVEVEVDSNKVKKAQLAEFTSTGIAIR